MRAGQEHRYLRMTNSQITLKENSNGDNGEYLEYMEDVSKTNSGGMAHSNLKQFVVLMKNQNVCRGAMFLCIISTFHTVLLVHWMTMIFTYGLF